MRTTLTDANRRRFLEAFAKCGVIGEAAMRAKIHRNSHYVWLQDPDYQRQFESAREEACDLLESEMWQRGVNGVEEPVIFQGELCYAKRWNRKTQKFEPTKKPLTIRKYSDLLLMFLAKAWMPEKYRDNWKGIVEHRGVIGHSPHSSPALDLSKLTDQQLATLDGLFQVAATANGHTALAVNGNGHTAL